MNPRSGLVLLLGCGLVVALACAPAKTVRAGQDEPAVPPPDPAVGVAASDHAPPPPGDDGLSADAWLKRLDARAQQLTTLKARLKYVTVQGLLQDEQTRYGDLLYAAPVGVGNPDGRPDTPERFAIHLDREAIDGQPAPIDRWLIFDGRWLLDRDHDLRQATRRELLPAEVPPAAGEEAGADPAADAVAEALPIPLRVDRDVLLRQYEVSLGADEAENAETVRLDFAPRVPDERDPLTVWFDRKTLLPVRASTLGGDGDRTEVALFRVEEGAAIAGDAFDTALPDAPNWDVQVVPLD